MKIAVAAEGNELSSKVSRRFGRTEYFIIYDMETGEFEAVKNDSGGGGAGIKAGNLLALKGAEYAITGGGIGPNAHEALSAAKIRGIGNFEGTVEEAVAAFKKGELKVTHEPLS